MSEYEIGKEIVVMQQQIAELQNAVQQLMHKDDGDQPNESQSKR